MRWMQTPGVRFALVNRWRNSTLCCTYPKRRIGLRQRLLAVEENNRRRNTRPARTTLCHSASVPMDGRRSVTGSGLDGGLGAAKIHCGRLRDRELEGLRCGGQEIGSVSGREDGCGRCSPVAWGREGGVQYGWRPHQGVERGRERAVR